MRYRFILSYLSLTLCFSHPSIKLSRVRHVNSTSNLKNHVKRCAPRKDSKTIKDHIPGAKYSKALMRFMLLAWIARQHRLYAIVEDLELREIFQMLYARVDVPSARTISRDVQEVFELSKMNLIAMLKVCVSCSFFFHLLTCFRRLIQESSISDWMGGRRRTSIRSWASSFTCFGARSLFRWYSTLSSK